MKRIVRVSCFAAPVLVAAWFSFACGKAMRKSADETAVSLVRLSAMPEAHLVAAGKPKQAVMQDVDAAQSFLEVLRYVKTEFVDRVEDDRKLGFGAVRTMLVSLDDPKTRFLDPLQRKLLLQRLNGEFHGIGATLAVVKQNRHGIDQRRVAIVAPAPGGPADRAGLRSGDIVAEVDGQWIIAYDTRQDLDSLRASLDEAGTKKVQDSPASRTRAGISLPRALDALGASDGRKLSLTIERAGEKEPLRVSMTTAETLVLPVEYRELSSKVGYLRVTQFNDRAEELVYLALAKARDRALILDLRDNPGGLVSSPDKGALGAALALLGRVLPTGPVAVIQRAAGKVETIQPSTGRVGMQTRLVALTNNGTCNLAEMVAAALRDRAGAKLVGQRTFGDAIWRKFFELREGAAMTVTAGKMTTCKGNEFAGKGLQPDEVVATAGPKWNDIAAKRALYLLERAL